MDGGRVLLTWSSMKEGYIGSEERRIDQATTDSVRISGYLQWRQRQDEASVDQCVRSVCMFEVLQHPRDRGKPRFGSASICINAFSRRVNRRLANRTRMNFMSPSSSCVDRFHDNTMCITTVDRAEECQFLTMHL